MRIAIISDSHTKENLELILDYLKKKDSSWRLRLIIINGDVLGENEIREGYGFGYNKKIFETGLNRDKMLESLAPVRFQELKSIRQFYESAKKDEKEELKLAGYIRDYVAIRYDHVVHMLKKFSHIAKTLFNVGTYESPLHYLVLDELAFLLEVDKNYLRRLAMLTNYRDTYKEFLKKINDPKQKKLDYIGGTTYLEGDMIIAGIPGLNKSTVPSDKPSEFQEKITKDLINTIKRQLSYANKLILLNQTQGRLRKDPFSFRPASFAVRNFIEESKGKLKHKVFVQSYHHWMTTHFYEASDFHFILNNGAVNNGLFNILEIGNNVVCYDVDPKLDRVRKLKEYNFNLVDYNTPEERLALNYENPEEIRKERKLDSCYYM